MEYQAKRLGLAMASAALWHSSSVAVGGTLHHGLRIYNSLLGLLRGQSQQLLVRAAAQRARAGTHYGSRTEQATARILTPRIFE
jgi:hypothetical protein